MNSKYITQKINYDGSQLRPLYAYSDHQVKGSSIVAFCGACDVSLEHMVDMEDKVVRAKIKSNEMLHFIIEIFPANLPAAVSMQRLFATMAQEWLNTNSSELKIKKLTREGDDLYLGQAKDKKKLSISIASNSSVSSMIHFAMNMTNKGTPVPTLCLKDLNVDPKKAAQSLMKIFSSEYESIIEATEKVKPLG